MNAYYHPIEEYAQNEINERRREASEARLVRMIRRQRQEDLSRDLQGAINGLLERLYRRRPAAEAR